MTTQPLALTQLSDQDLLNEGKRRAKHERDATASLIASLMELDARRLYLGEGCASLFTYCTQVLHLSEHAAYLRMEAAPAAGRFPIILQLLADGAIHLTAIGLLAPHLTPANHAAILEQARHKSKRDVNEIVAGLHPRASSLATSPKSRHIPAVVRRAVWNRDGGRCAFVGTNGRCAETGVLEFHHRIPFAAGGEPSIENVGLRCKSHNRYEAEQYFGPTYPPLLREARSAYGAGGELGPEPVQDPSGRLLAG